MGTRREGRVVTWGLGRVGARVGTSDPRSGVEGNVEITLVETDGRWRRI